MAAPTMDVAASAPKGQEEASDPGRHAKPDNQSTTLAAIPCYNEEVPVAGVVLRARKHVTQVLVVDDGSTDKTAENAYLAGAVVIQHAQNLGKGAAVRTALRYAATNGFDAVVFLDGDGQHDPDEIPLVLEPVLRRDGSVDLGLGFRHGTNSEMPSYRRVGKRVLDVATAAAGGGLTDSQCGFRSFGRRAIEGLAPRLRAERFAVESETLALARELGLRSENVTVHCRYDGLDGSTQHPVSHGLEVLNQIFVMLTMRRPLLTVGLPGLFFILLGAFWGLRMLQVYNEARVFVMSYALAAATSVILGGIMVATALMLNLFVLMRRSQEAAKGSA